ncbi:hypothetical protein BGZ65_010272, partial [Modicella reniformis]
PENEEYSSLVIPPQLDLLEIICCPYSDDLRWLVVSGLDIRSLSRLTRLKLSGEGLDDWIKELSRVLMPQSVPFLEELCLAAGDKRLLSESTRWIASMLSPSLQKISLTETRLSASSWDGIFSSMDLSNIRSLDFTGSTISQTSFKKMIEKMPEDAKLESLVLNCVRWTDESDQDECRNLLWGLKKKAKSVDIQGQT